MEYFVKAPGKLILIGEYAVLEGAPALVMAVNRYARLTMTAQPGHSFILHSPTLNISDLTFKIKDDGKIEFTEKMQVAVRKQLSFFIETLQYIWQKEAALRTLPARKIMLDTSDFYLREGGEKLGLGSSAALTVALLAGFLSSDKKSIAAKDRPRIFQWAQEIHRLVQEQIGSGIDIAASVYGGLISFQREGESCTINSLSLPPDMIILPVWSGISASTTTLVRKVNQLRSKYPKKYWTIIRQLQEISQEAILFLQEKNTPAFLKNIRRYFEILINLDQSSGAGIISSVHQKLAHIAYSSGAVYKTSGAGGGDMGLVFTDSRDIARKVTDNLLHSGYQILNFNISKWGVAVVRPNKD